MAINFDSFLNFCLGGSFFLQDLLHSACYNVNFIYLCHKINHFVSACDSVSNFDFYENNRLISY